MPGYQLLEADKATIPDKYMCSFCELLLRDARQTPCGHFYCDSCVQTLTGTDSITCLIDAEICPIGQVYPDNFVRREVMALVVRCINADAGCKWRGEVRHLTKHGSECEYQKTKCTHSGCDAVVLRRDLQSHLTNDCQYRTAACPYCEKEVSMVDMQKHQENECVKFPIPCPKCNMEGISRDMMTSHLDPFWGECSELEGPCPFSLLGCPAKEVMSKERRAKHMNNTTSAHLSLLQRDYIALKRHTEMSSPASAQSTPSTSNEGLKDKVVKDLIAKVETLVLENASMKRQIAEQSRILLEVQQRQSAAFDIALELPISSNAPLTDKNSSEFLKDLRRRVASVESRLAHYQASESESKQRMNDQVETLNEIKHKVEELSTTQQVMDTRLHSQETTLGMNSVAMADMEDGLRDLSLVTYDGILVWKITDFARKRTDAVAGRETSFYSHAFYSKRQGYKMCARIYLNGDGMGRGNSISLFFVVMRGEYDALLRWPFRQKVTMMLLDQDNVEHVIDAFRPDPASSSFQRPRAKMNVASGCPLFCPLTELPRHAYVREDTMFIKVIVDTIDS